MKRNWQHVSLYILAQSIFYIPKLQHNIFSSGDFKKRRSAYLQFENERRCKFLKKTFAFVLVFSFFANAYTAFAKRLIPVGETIGISIMTDGLLVIDTQEFTDENGNRKNPAKTAGIKSGDTIISADGNKINSTEDLSEYVDTRENDIVLTVKRNGQTENCVISPIKSSEGTKLGLWVRDSTAGLGTLTFIDPETKSFGALGHGISDIDTDTLLTCREGKILGCLQDNATRGEKGTPGELNGHFSSEVLGNFQKNSNSGIFGKISTTNIISEEKIIDTASFSEITESEAKILSNVDGKGVMEYSIEIKKLNEENLDGKNIVFKVIDEQLISKTGGIVQGMSGSPILQNGKLVGAVTHVFVNDPTRGYGIFIDNMIREAEKTE